VAILEEMKAIHWSLCIAAAHQQKAIAALDNLPAERRQALVNYVSQ
jgi:hypothetical protein